MKSSTPRVLLPQLLRFLLLVTLPFAAYAAEQTIHQQDTIAQVTMLTWLFLWIFSTGGWAIVHLDTLVEWYGADGTLEERKALWRERLKIVKNYVASLTAGGGFFLLAVSVPKWIGLNFDLPEMVILVGSVPAAMGGTMTWDKIKTQFGL